MDDAKRRADLVVEMDAIELAVRLAETATGMRRQKGKSAADAWRDVPEDVRPQFYNMAVAAINFFGESFNHGQRPS